MKSRAHMLVALFLVVSIFGHAHQAQSDKTTMTLTGVVYDRNGSVIVGTRVFAQDSDGKRYEATTNEEGMYKLQLPLASYKVEAASPGFCPSMVERFKIVNATHGRMSLDLVLDVAPSHGPCREIKVKEKRRERNKKNRLIAVSLRQK